MTDMTSAQPSETTPAASRRRGTTRPTVSVRPVAVGVLNAATIAGATAVAAGGGMILAAAAAGAGAVAAASGASRTVRAKHARRVARERTQVSKSSGTGGLPPRPGSPTLGRRGGSGGGGAGVGRATPSGTGRGQQRRTATTGTGGGTGFRKSGSQPGSGTRSPLTADRVAAARRRIAARRQAGPRLGDAVRAGTKPTSGKRPTPMQAARAARQAITGDNPKKRGPLRLAMAGAAAAGLAAARAAWQERKRRRRREAARQAKLARIAERHQQQPHAPRVRTAVRRPVGQPQTGNHTPQPTTEPAAKPAPIDNQPTSDKPVEPAVAGGKPMSRLMLALSEEMVEVAGRHQPEGMLQVTAEAKLLPEILDNLARAMKLRYEQAQGHPLHGAIKDMYGAVHQAQLAVIGAAEEIHPTIERVHKDELDRLRNPQMRGDESMWDTTKNMGIA